MNILQAMSDRKVFGTAFRKTSEWQPWKVFLASLFGLPLDESERRFFKRCTGRPHPRGDGYTEAWLVIGRRGGKSFVLALIACFLALFRDYRPFLGPGERAVIMIIAADRKQARVIMRYVKGLLRSSSLLARSIENERAEAVDLTNRVSIEIMSASFRLTRGYSLAACLADEIAFWRSEEAANPDTEILNAVRPAMATIPGAVLLCASSPYSRRGALWEAYRRFFGRDDASALIWQAPTRLMNPSVPQKVVDEAMERDASHALAEFGAQFRTDIESFVTIEAVQACVTVGTFERRPLPNVRYEAFCDPSGGSADSMCIAIGHKEGNIAVLDCMREVKPPFDPDLVVREFAALLKSYRLSSTEGDRYAAGWVTERFKAHGIRYEAATRSKSDLYLAFLPTVNAKSCKLLDSQRLIQQLVSLERRTTRGSGRDVIDHPPNMHDDLCNVAAGVIANIMDRPRMQVEVGIITGYGGAGAIVPLHQQPPHLAPPRALTGREGVLIQRPYYR